MTDSDRRALRRRLGPVAWCVLEDLIDDARVDALGRTVVSSSVRRLAENLGVSKDTTARALRRLTAGDLIAALPARRGEGGRFGGGAYLIRSVPSRDDARSDCREAPARVTTARARRPRVRSTETSQQSLFDAFPDDGRAGAAAPPEADDAATRTPRTETAGREAASPEGAAADRKRAG